MKGGQATEFKIGRFTIVDAVGQGVTGTVYRAHDPRMSAMVALKVIEPRVAASRGFRERFLRDSRACSKLWHPNIAVIHEAGEARGVLYASMPLVEGVDLATLVEREGPLSRERAARIVAQAGAALAAAHGREVVHRGIKPRSLLVASEDGNDKVYLTDFGLTADLPAEDAIEPPEAGYAPPEQIAGRRLSAETDIYALGSLLGFLLTGSPPLQRDDVAATLAAQLYEDPPAEMPGVTPEMRRVIVQAIAKKPAERYGSAAALGDAALAAAGLESSEQGAASETRRRRVIAAWQRSVAAGGREWGPSDTASGALLPTSAAAPPPADADTEAPPVPEPEPEAFEPEPEPEAVAPEPAPEAEPGAEPGPRPLFRPEGPQRPGRRRKPSTSRRSPMVFVGLGLIAIAIAVALLAAAGAIGGNANRSTSTPTQPGNGVEPRAKSGQSGPPGAAPGRLTAWPKGRQAYTAVVYVSPTDRDEALRRARRVADRLRLPTGVLRSDDYPSLKRGSWVTFAGIYRSQAAAQRTVDRLRGDVADVPYVRFVGDLR